MRNGMASGQLHACAGPYDACGTDGEEASDFLDASDPRS
jgi:hypothetical protein